MSAMVLGFIADVAAGLLIIFHAAALARLVPSKLVKPVALLAWLVLSIGFIAVVCLGSVIYTSTWECDQPVIPTLRLADSFDLSYGLPFAVVGCASSLISLLVMLFGLHYPKEKPSKGTVGLSCGPCACAFTCTCKFD